jgi:iron(III) transport system substrate-binding protein
MREVLSRRHAALGLVAAAALPGRARADLATLEKVVMQRLMLDIKNHTPHCDVFSTTDPSHMLLLRERGELTQYRPESFATMRPEFQAQSAPDWYHATNAGRWILLHNRDKIPTGAAPRMWTDLLDPKWKGQVSVAHPAFSGGAGIWALAMKKLHGWEFFEALAKNEPRVGRSTIDTVTLIGGGECLVGPTFAPNAYRNIDKGSPITITQPSDGVVVMVFPSAIPAHAPHPNAARLFMEWTLSPAWSKMIAADGSEPINATVAPRADEPALATQIVLAPTVEEIRAGVPEVIERWRDIFGA